MPFLLLYLIKLSCSLAVVYLFYRLLLRRLTFYTANRWYLLGYSVLCFFIPFINIEYVIERHPFAQLKVVQAIPVLETYTSVAREKIQQVPTSVSVWPYCLALFAFGVFVLLARLFLQALSYRRMRNNAQLLASDGLKLYQVDHEVTPFSFGDSIFINPQLHSEPELKEIIRHEFVHVTQRHTIDIIWTELLCIFNWYNPFAWALRQAVRQNLEFIADDQVVQSGVNKKDYQYLLLKVMGTSQFSIAAPFNFSALKKRIVMMNKIKSAKAHLVKFLFMLPLLAVLLLAFRSQQIQKKERQQIAIATADTMPAPPAPPAITTVAPVPEKEPHKGAPPAPVAIVGIGLDGDTSLLPEDYKAFFDRNPSVKNIRWTERNMIVELKSGKKEVYQRGNEKSMDEAERKWGKLPVAPPPPPPPPMVTPPVAPIADTTNPPGTANEPADVYREQMDFLKEKIAQLNNSLTNEKDTAQLKVIKDYLQQQQIALQRQQVEIQKYMQENEKYRGDEQEKQAQIYQKKMAMLTIQQQKMMQKNIQDRQDWKRKQIEMQLQMNQKIEKMQAQNKELWIRKQQMQERLQKQEEENQIRLQKEQEIRKKKLEATHE